MKKMFSAPAVLLAVLPAVLLATSAPAWSASSAPLTSLRAIQSLSNAQAGERLPVAFEATVTYYGGYEATLFVQDSGAAIYVMTTAYMTVVPGDRVLIKGATQPSFHPIVTSGDITVLRHGALPPSVPAAFSPLIQGKLDCTYVAVRGVVRSAELTMSSGRHVTQLELAMDGGSAGVTVDSSEPARLKGLLDSEVEILGVASGRFDSKMQLVGVLIHVTSMDSVKILRKAASDAQSLPVTPMDKVLNVYDVQDRSRRVRVEGTLTYFHPAAMAVLQDGNRSIRVLTPEVDPLKVGDRVEATGIPVIDDGFQALELGEITTIGAAPPVVPLPVNWDDLSTGRNAFDLVSIEGKVVSQVREQAQDMYVISANDQLLSAALRHPYTYDPKSDVKLPPMVKVQPGSEVRVTGVAIFDGANRFNGALTFGILLRSPSDVTVLANPTLLNVDNLILVVGVLLAAVFAFGARGWALERKVHGQATQLAARIEADANLERRRSRILEDINGSRPLAEIIEQITALVSFKMGGVPCWCQIVDGARLGTFPAHQDARNVVRHEIPSRAGQPIGTLFAYLALPGPASTGESEALATGAGLAELAIENRRLYSDLLHRSEFDQLTDIHNRFSIEKHLDALIVEAREMAGIFGLIYIDLDGFKEVNDLHGHQAGDIYLHKVAQRMKSQLRTADMLARLGGDEFAALLPMVRSRADAEDVAQRLKRSFDEPFALDDVQLRGSASTGIALYPEDGATRDSLLGAADAAMYAAKHARQSPAETVQPAAQSKGSA